MLKDKYFVYSELSTHSADLSLSTSCKFTWQKSLDSQRLPHSPPDNQGMAVELEDWKMRHTSYSSFSTKAFMRWGCHAEVQYLQQLVNNAPFDTSLTDTVKRRKKMYHPWFVYVGKFKINFKLHFILWLWIILTSACPFHTCNYKGTYEKNVFLQLPELNPPCRFL